MDFEIFFALIGLPVLILVTAVVCYIHTGRKGNKKMKNLISNDKNTKGGVSQ